VLLAAISFLFWTLRQRSPYLLIGWLWFLGTLVPVIGIVQEGMQSLANRYTYIPMIGVLIALVWATAEFLKRWNRIVLASAVALLIILSFKTRAEISYWKDSQTLWKRTITITKDNYAAYNCLGIILSSDKDALTNFMMAVAIKPDFAEAQRNLANALISRTNYAEAAQHLKISLQLDPSSGWAEHSLAQTLLATGNLGEALFHFRKAISLEPGNTNYITNYAIALNNIAWRLATDSNKENRSGETAVELAKRACELTGNSQSVFVVTLAVAYAETGNFDKAGTTLQIAISVAKQHNELNSLEKFEQLAELFRNHQAYHNPTAR
jgi:tetratricopeptide (TPR) repeat protein